MTKLFDKKVKYDGAIAPTLFIVMGVSGSGKTAIGKKLATELNKHTDCEFLDADDFHSPQAKQRMAANLPLDDGMRKPWVASIMNKLTQLHSQNKHVVLAFSGLKFQHRECLRTLKFTSYFYHLHGDINLIQARMLERKNHFFKPALLASQFLAMEAANVKEKDIIQIDVAGLFDDVYQQVFIHAQQVLVGERGI